MTAAIELLRPGLLTTVQDLGRPGLGAFGVSPSGAMDPLALRLANRLAGNAEGAPALEITGPGVEIAFDGALVFVLAGGDLGALLDGAAVPLFRAVRARPGQVLRLAARRRGGRVVLAVAGGLEAPSVMGSAATDLDAGLGAGRLPRGARLPVRAPERPVPGGPRDRAALAALVAVYDDRGPLRFVPAADPAVPAEARARFAATPFRVSDRSNRTGYRLRGPGLPAQADPERLSEPIAPGTVQLPPDGQPILLMADRQTTGGYPRLGHLAAVDRPRAAQLLPGDEVRFAPLPLEEARRAARAREAALEMV